jgi:hypothetical protein
MRLKELKDLIKKSMVEVAPKKDSGVMTPEEEEIAAAAMAAIDRYETEEEPNKYALDKEEPMEEDILREADDIVAAYAEKKTLKEADLSQANFNDLNQVVRNIAHVNEVRMEEAAMQAIEYIAEQFDVPVDFKDFN